MNYALLFSMSYVIVDMLSLILALIIAGTVSRDLGTKDQNESFLYVLLAFMIFVVFDAVWALLAYSGLFSASDLTLSVINGINLTAVACAGYLWLRLTLAYLGSGAPRSWARRYLPALPALLVPVIHTIGYMLGQNVIVQPDGTMTYGWAHTTITLITLYYVFGATGIASHLYRQAHTKEQRRMCLVFMSFMLPFIVAGIVDTLIAGTPIVAACLVASFTFVMMSMQDLRISSDALTGLNNRRRTDSYLEESMEHISHDKPLFLFIIDLDGFKGINDTYGHLEGDRALCLMADTLRAVCASSNAFAARWGGDEFVVICTKSAKDDPSLIPNFIKETLAEKVAEANVPYQLTCSVGYTVCTSPDEDCDTAIAQADEMLYEVKRAKNAAR